MPPTRRRRTRRRRSAGPLVAVLVLAGLAGAAIRLFFWGHAPATPSAPLAAVAPSSTPVAARTPATVPTVRPEATAEPTPAPSPSAAASAEPGVPPVPRAGGGASAGNGRLAIIIDDCGQWPQTERGFIALPIPLTLSVLPHVRYGDEIARAAEAAGKGVMLHLPMETVSGLYPGPGTVTTEMDDATIEALVRSDLGDVPFARGVNNHEGSRATADARVMGDVIDVLASEGRFFIDSKTSSKSVAEEVAQRHGVPTAARDVFLDNRDDAAAVAAQLRRAAAIARSGGTAIAIGHPRPATLAAVRTVTPELAASGIEFVLASDLVR